MDADGISRGECGAGDRGSAAGVEVRSGCCWTDVEARGEGNRGGATAGDGETYIGMGESPITLVVGPEGGIEDDELEKFVAAGFVKASIGSTILRFETAAIAALAVVQASTSTSTS